jgi:hypothetical protein
VKGKGTMSKLNEKRPSREHKARESAHLNFMGGTSFDVNDPFLRLRMIAASSFFGEPKYYSDQTNSFNKVSGGGIQRGLTKFMFEHLVETLGEASPYTWRSMSSREIMEKCIDECLDKDVEKTLQLAVKLRNEDFMRATPQVILVRAACHRNSKGTSLIRKYAPEICKRGDEPAAGLAYFFDACGRGKLPNSLKRAWKDILESFNDYTISKYKMENNVVKTVDLCSSVHAFSKSIDKLFKGKAKQTKTWNAIMSNADNSTKEKKEKNWEKALEGMPHMALLRNLRNLAENNVDISLYYDKLIGGVLEGKQLPFRYLSAYESLKGHTAHQDLVEECLEASIENVPHFSGKTMCLSDNSGSAHGALTSEYGTMSVAQIGNLMSVITAKASDDGYVGIFGDKLDVIPIRKRSSIFDDVEKCKTSGSRIGGATENGIWLFFDKAIREKQHWDNIFVYSDMQAGHGGLYGTNPSDYKKYVINKSYIDVAMLIKEYRKQVNPNVMVYLVQTAGYQDTLVPEFYDRTFIIGGWSTGILNFAKEMEDIFNK